MALLNSSSARCVVCLEVVEKLGMRLKQLKVPIVFCQLDGTLTGRPTAHFITEPVEMRMKKHRDSEFYSRTRDGETPGTLM